MIGHRLSFLLLLAVLAVAGCRNAIPTPVSPEALSTVPPPNVRGLDADVQAQIEAEQSAVADLAGRAGAAPAALGEAYGRLGMLYLAYGLEGAEAALSNARGLLPADPRWPYYLGRLHWRGGQLEQALADFSQADALRPDDIPTQVHLAQVQLDLDQPDEAERRLNAVLAREPDHALALSLLGEIAAAEGDHAAAVEHFTRALQRDPSAGRLHYMLGIAYRNLGEVEKSREHLARRGDAPARMRDPLAEALDALKKGSSLLVNQAGIALREGRVETAIALYRKAIAEDSGNATAHLNLGAALAQSGDLRGAIAEIEEAARLTPEDGKVQQSLGTVLLRAREAEKAEAALREAVALDAQNGGARLVLADLLRRTERCAEAIPLYVEGLKQDPSQMAARVQQALCHGRLGEWPEGRALLEANATAFPDNPDALDALARLLAAAPDDAVRDGRRALELAEAAVALRRSADTVETLAMAQAELGRFEEAIGTQREAITLAEKGSYADWLAVLRANLDLYGKGQAARTPWPAFLFGL